MYLDKRNVADAAETCLHVSYVLHCGLSASPRELRPKISHGFLKLLEPSVAQQEIEFGTQNGCLCYWLEDLRISKLFGSGTCG